MRNEYDDEKRTSTSHLCGSSYFFNDNTEASVCYFHVAIMTNFSVTALITLKSNIVVPKIGTRTLCCCLSVFVQLPVCANRPGTCHKSEKCIMTHPSTLCVAKCGVRQKRLAVCVGPPILFMTIENNVYAIIRTRWLCGLRSIRTSLKMPLPVQSVSNHFGQCHDACRQAISVGPPIFLMTIEKYVNVMWRTRTLCGFRSKRINQNIPVPVWTCPRT